MHGCWANSTPASQSHIHAVLQLFLTLRLAPAISKTWMYRIDDSRKMCYRCLWRNVLRSADLSFGQYFPWVYYLSYFASVLATNEHKDIKEHKESGEHTVCYFALHFFVYILYSLYLYAWIIYSLSIKWLFTAHLYSPASSNVTSCQLQTHKPFLLWQYSINTFSGMIIGVSAFTEHLASEHLHA